LSLFFKDSYWDKEENDMNVERSCVADVTITGMAFLGAGALGGMATIGWHQKIELFPLGKQKIVY
jgi:hypothetical protein